MEENKYLIVSGKKTRIIDLTGKIFGRLLVMKNLESRITKGGQTKTRWLCKCECGNFKEVDAGKLKNGEVKSCGCLNRELVSKRSLKDLTGFKFGELIVIDRAEDYISPKGKHVVMWNCLCNCGNYTTVAVNSLRRGETTSCGCIHKEIIVRVSKENAIAKNGSLGDWILKNLPENFIKLCWSNKNKLSPFEMPYAGAENIYLICPECESEYSLKTYSFTSRKQGCPICSLPKGEQKIKKVLDIFNIKYDIHKEFEGLVGLKNGLLSYDFYLPVNNLLIEYQGNFHDGSNGEYTQINLEAQQEHDRRKRQYAQDNNINLLEIWYWDFDNIEEILKKELKIN